MRPFEFGSLFWKPPEDWLPPGGAACGEEALKVAMDEASVWSFHPTLQSSGVIRLAPRAAWVIWLVVGTEEGDALTYDVDVTWHGDASGAEAALQSLQLAVRDHEE